MTREIRKLNSILCLWFVLDFFVHIDQGNDEEKSFILIVLDKSGKFFDKLIFFDFDVLRNCFGQVFDSLTVKVRYKKVFIVLLDEVVIFLAVRYDVGDGLLSSNSLFILLFGLLLDVGKLDLFKS